MANMQIQKYSILIAACAASISLGLVPARSHAQDIAIVGHRSPDNRFDYIWTVTNHSDKRITMLRVDHYFGKTVTPPKGWVRTEMTGNRAEGQRLVPGIIEFQAETPRKGIGRNQEREFRVNVDVEWRGLCSRRTVTVGFDDGTTMDIPDVLCPSKESWLKQNVSLVGLGVMFALFVLGRMLFRKKNPATESADDVAGDASDQL
ncbi:MAG: hypothetical protein GXP29_03355 [Planctomycetes bacterium]|nr:hypothetical protein [Planctomycetota bacterium]